LLLNLGMEDIFSFSKPLFQRFSSYRLMYHLWSITIQCNKKIEICNRTKLIDWYLFWLLLKSGTKFFNCLNEWNLSKFFPALPNSSAVLFCNLFVSMEIWSISARSSWIVLFNL
jgi:hypothetical protein